jgi:2-succinyl-5-enolpyruvyl-6-hydroxy-3-cyclohexene-1-carboxylate synthase
MPDANLNALWCRCIAEELQRSGCRHVVLCPGSRNSPLLFALAAVFGERVSVHIDERGAGFLALGMAKALGEPVAVCVTSGTAAANLLPAACEADATGIPLLLLTADRPWEAQGCGAPQTMPQRGLFAALADTVEIGEPLGDDQTLRLLRGRVARAVQRACRPLHLNMPLRDPLPPLSDPAWSPAGLSAAALHGRDGLPWVWVGEVRASGGLSAAEPHLRPGLRGLIVAGAACDIDPGLVAALAAGTGYPVLADAPSGLRRPAVPGVVGTLDALVDTPLGHEPAELILRVGPPPLARSAWEWLARQACPQLVLGGGRDNDYLATATVHWTHPDRQLVDDLIDRLARGDQAWSARWSQGEAAAQRARVAALAGWDEPAIFATALAEHGFPLLWLASSMPVRHANLHLAPGPAAQRVLSNRGVNGIDGTVASFLGSCLATSCRGLCLLGDLALLHDLNSLAAAGPARGAILVVNNGGGAIFDFLPVAQVPGYRRLVRADHDLDFAHAAAQFRLPYRRCADMTALRAALGEAQEADALLLIECDLRGVDGVAAHRQVLQGMRAAAI